MADAGGFPPATLDGVILRELAVRQLTDATSQPFNPEAERDIAFASDSVVINLCNSLMAGR